MFEFDTSSEFNSVSAEGQFHQLHLQLRRKRGYFN